MNDPLDTFMGLRSRLRGIAYRMLGSAADAEEVVQDAWLRWHGTDTTAVANAEAWLVAVTTRLAIDRLRAAQARREDYVGTWLPEPILTAADAPHTPEQVLERADQLSVAFLTVLERLAPEARAAFLLRDIFEADYGEVAAALGKSEAACRQLVHRARTLLKDGRSRQTVAPEDQQRLLRAFAEAATRGDIAGLKAALTEDAELISDGGGKVPSFGVPLLGGQRIAQLYMAVSLRYAGRVHYELAELNGEWGLLRFIDGALESAQALQIEGGRVVRIHTQRNPDKLARIAEARGDALVDPAVTHYVTKGDPASS
ncbi:MAG: RNA polymerase sigma-70 factor [Hydrogenophaga sp.]|nr:RNA polymerase sigma-70 factor [Hydrogenophaga sp.]